MEITKKTILATSLTVSLLLTGCGSGSSGSSDLPESSGNTKGTSSSQDNTVAQEVSFDYKFSSIVTQELAASEANQASTNSGVLSIQAADLMTGNLTVTNTDSGVVDVQAWAIYIDEADLNDVQSQKTLALVPGNYSFSLVLTKGDHQYVGEAIQSVSDTAQALVAMTISPVIGDTLDTVDVTELVDFKFQYLAAELTDAGLIAPYIGITIDDNNEQIFALNPETGISESMYLNLMPGSYNIALRLLDGNVQVGRSVSAQESSVVVSPGLDVSMDIIPLYAEVGLELTVDGGDAAFNFSIPSVVVEEAGGIGSLDVLFSVVGDENTLQESLLNLTEGDGVYEASVILAGMYYGDVTLSLAFTDNDDSELLGSCLNMVTLRADVNNVVCDLDLRRRSVIAGSILSVLGVNVFAINGEPVAGAVISVDTEEVAMTNSAAFSTLGYSKLYLKAGTRTVRATANGLYGEVSIDSIPLNVTNVDITLDQQVLTLIPVRFYAEPEGAMVVAGNDSCIIIEGNCDLELAIGDYLVELSAAGYVSAEPYPLSVVNSSGMGIPLGSLVPMDNSLACFSLTNTLAEDLIGNDWFDACITAPGDTVQIVLKDGSGTVVYDAQGSKVGVWTQDHITSTTDISNQYNSNSHDRLIALDNGDTLFIAGKTASNSGCGGSLGNGYGIVVYPAEPDYYRNLKIMAMPHIQTINWLSPRSFSGWTAGNEISYAGGTTFAGCTDVSGAAFMGSLEFFVFP